MIAWAMARQENAALFLARLDRASLDPQETLRRLHATHSPAIEGLARIRRESRRRREQ
ncbi:hypothetical protein PV620_32650 [Streptomyces sp. ME02-6978a]|nr:hypothetical protein [Streptomyces sp. ME02-6978a]